MIRELFVELGAAAFAEAKALGEAFEAAIVEAAKQHADPQLYRARKLGLAHPDVWIVLFKTVEHAVKWKLIGWQREPHGEYIVVRVRLQCGHVGRFFVDERSLFRASVEASDLITYVLKIIEGEPEHRCKCGTQQGLGPAGRPM